MRFEPIPTRSRAAIAAVLLALTSAGCTTSSPLTRAQAEMPPTYEERHPILLARMTQSVPIDIGTHSLGITGLQRADIESFARAYSVDGDGTVLISVPRGGANQAAALRATGEIRQILAIAGIPAAAVSTRSYYADPGVLAPPVTLSYSRLHAAVPHPCRVNADFDMTIYNRQQENFGCASQTNFAALVANPNDINRPRPMDRANPTRRYKVLDQYRDANDTTTVYRNPNFGAVSRVGQ